jgi:hypothetical protein
MWLTFKGSLNNKHFVFIASFEQPTFKKLYEYSRQENSYDASTDLVTKAGVERLAVVDAL